ncbi:MAG TPA: sulfite exporter TauE/SafE family protein [Candidatus Limnocylindria bacterium]
MKRRRWPRALWLAVALAAVPAVATAHPLGNFSINHYAAVTVSPELVVVDLVVDTAEIPTLAILPTLDQDRDGSVDDVELEVAATPACRGRATELDIAIGGRPTRLSLEAAHLELVPGAGGLHTLRTTCDLRGRLDAPIASSTTLSVVDAGDPDRPGWREIVVRADGGVLLADPAVSVDVSARLTAYPGDLLDQPLDERSLDVTLAPGTDAQAPAPAADPRPSGEPAAGGLPTIDFRQFSPAVALLGLVVAAVSGAGHAVTPGHGKTLMAAYLIGSRGRQRDALLLGVAVTISHTTGVLVLAALVLVAGSTLPADRLYPILSAVSGAIVIVIGAWLLVGCLRRPRVSAPHGHDHGHDHHHVHPHSHPHSHPHPHPQRHDADPPAGGRAGLLAIGLAGGMIPSPAALVLLLGAIAAGQPAYGLLLALAFGVGMATILAGLGLLIVRGRDRAAAVSKRLPLLRRLVPAVPWVAAIVVLAAGVALTGGAVVAAV